MKDYGDLLVDIQDGIATVTLNSPEKLNAFTTKMRAALPQMKDDLNRDNSVRVVIVTGAARGIGLATSIHGRNPLIDGFGLIALASLMPMIFVMLLGIARFGLNMPGAG